MRNLADSTAAHQLALDEIRFATRRAAAGDGKNRTLKDASPPPEAEGSHSELGSVSQQHWKNVGQLTGRHNTSVGRSPDLY